MSHEAVNWAYQQQVGDPITKFVLVTLADHADRAHRCFPSQRHLAERTSASERKVRDSLAQLEDAGLIARVARVRTKGRGRSADEVRLAVDGPILDVTEEARSTGIRRRQVAQDQPARGAARSAATNRHEVPQGQQRPTGTSRTTNRHEVPGLLQELESPLNQNQRAREASAGAWTRPTDEDRAAARTALGMAAGKP